MSQYDLIVIGGGPGGYVAAIRAAQLGLNVACIDANEQLGGTCLRVGCIPSKAMLESSEKYAQLKHGLADHGIKLGKVELDLAAMLKRKEEVVKTLTSGIDGLLKKNKITRYLGMGALSPHAEGSQLHRVTVKGKDNTELEAKHIIIATGSKVASLKGIEFDGDRVGSSTEALAYDKVPGHLVVIGAGYIGMEMGSVWLRLGARVTMLEYLDRILPGMDSDIAADAHKLFKKQGFDFKLGAKVTGAKVTKDGCIVEVEGREPIKCDKVLVAVGRAPNTEGLNLQAVGLQPDGRGKIEVNDHFETAVKNIYAIGDVIRGPMLAHKAEEEGVACAEYIVTGYGHVNYDAIPAVVYTHPEIASVGKTEDELKEKGVEYKKGVYHFRANGRARTLGETDGKVKILADAKTDRVLGVHILGNRAGDLIAEAAVAMEYGASSEDIARASHAHPTLAEAVKEAALAVAGRTING
ncbi:MAG: dihydrolipoyl dehydrogenase [Phycisphaeraceae bacterium]